MANIKCDWCKDIVNKVIGTFPDTPAEHLCISAGDAQLKLYLNFTAELLKSVSVKPNPVSQHHLTVNQHELMGELIFDLLLQSAIHCEL